MQINVLPKPVVSYSKKRKSLCALFTMCALDVGGCSWDGISSVEHWEGSRSTAGWYVAPSFISDVDSFKIKYIGYF